MRLKKTLGATLIIMGAILLLWSGYAVVVGGVSYGMIHLSSVGAIVPFIIGLIFFASGVKLVRAL